MSSTPEQNEWTGKPTGGMNEKQDNGTAKGEEKRRNESKRRHIPGSQRKA